ncbi:MAG: OmpA family protein [Granulosicoccus sp.]|nr:OmpA family protein [Granulosicoccus sp.]
MFYANKTRRAQVLLTIVCLLSTAGIVNAKCSDNARKEAQRLHALATSQDNIDEAVFTLRTAAQICEDYPIWMDLGLLALDRGETEDAADYFARARNMYRPDNNGEMSTGKLRRLGTANTFLADAFFETGKTADALQALEAAKRYFSAYRSEQPRRVLELQARIDDAMSAASAPVLTRSLKLQRTGRTRGVGIRQKVDEVSDEYVSEDLAMLTDANMEDLVDDQSLVLAQNNQSEPLTLATSERQDPLINPEATTQTAQAASAPDQASRLNIQVLFKFDSAEIDAAGQMQVEKMAEALLALELPDQTSVKIIGHTDINGDANYNQNLSEKRASAVATQIRAKVANLLLVPVGMGESAVRYPGTSREDHRRNRRVEILID